MQHIVVVCENCETKFKVPAIKIIPGGSGLRCCKCGYEWVVEISEASQFLRETFDSSSEKKKTKTSKFSIVLLVLLQFLVAAALFYSERITSYILFDCSDFRLISAVRTEELLELVVENRKTTPDIIKNCRIIGYSDDDTFESSLDVFQIVHGGKEAKIRFVISKEIKTLTVYINGILVNSM